MPKIDCVRCEADFDIAADQFGELVECPKCKTSFPAVAEPSVNYENSNSEDNADFREKLRVIETARAAVRRPARGLMICGWIGLGISILGGIGFVIAGLSQYLSSARSYSRYRNHDGPQLLAIGVLLFFTVIFHVLIAVGASRMVRLRSLRSGYLAATFAILSFLLFGPCLLVSIPNVIFGILAYIALANPDVRKAMSYRC
jgi:hypothetical protein